MSVEGEMLLPRRVRGLIGIALAWGVAISAIGAVFIVGGLAGGWFSHLPGMSWTQWVTQAGRVVARDFVGGTISGAAFAMLLGAAERHRSVDSLSLAGVGGWGFLASAVPTGFALATIGGVIDRPLALAAATVATGLVGAGLGIVMVRVARRASGGRRGRLCVADRRTELAPLKSSWAWGSDIVVEK